MPDFNKSGLLLIPHLPKVVVLKGVKYPIAISSGECSQMIDLACSSGGYVIQQFDIFDNLKPDMVVGEVPGTL